MTGNYNDYWLVFSILMGILFSYIALDLRWKMIIFKNFKYNLWLLGCAIAMGIGIWTMHFVGMFAMDMPSHSEYDARMVLLSLLISITGTGLAFFMMKMNHVRLLFSSLFMGGGIVGMHYLGMEAMHLNFSITYNPAIVLLSLCIASSAAFGSLWVLFFF